MNLKGPAFISSEKPWGIWLIALGASLWATDAIFRSKLVGSFSALEIVTVSHWICAPACLALVFVYRKHLNSLSLAQWSKLLYLAAGPSCVAMILFTQSFATAGNYNIPILVQKLQPVFAIGLSWVLLKERPSPKFWLAAPVAICGAFLISFGWSGCPGCLGPQNPLPIIYAFGAALIWGSGTVVGRDLVTSHPWLLITGIRYLLAAPLLAGALLIVGTEPNTVSQALSVSNLGSFAIMALVPGLLALIIYYKGLTQTPASMATLGELAYPAAAIGINWVILGQPLTIPQLVGTALLIGAITTLSRGIRTPIKP